ncbi:Beclin-1 [Phytophthora pseudosyringae]|uniref:Beclin-1 n=1 Tax=Phytophthora pseudosyringae TaxID=221518 RepID=A0A8T1W6G3_9STRA|nr:Beclin-1 [Phytophthora pseudosyringae]
MSSNGSLQPPLIITALPRPPATTGAPSAASGSSLSPAPSSASASFSPYAKSPAPSARRVAMEGKSLFTCHQCGALLKFQYSPVSIEEKIMKLRPVAYEHPTEPCGQRDSKADEEEDQMPRLTEGTDNGETTDADEEEDAAQAARNSLSMQQQQQLKTSAVVPEIVWERQRLDDSGDVDVWVPAEFDLMNGIAAFTSCNRGDIGQNMADVVPARLLNKPHLWVSDWEVDHSLPHCEEEGWVYAASYADFGEMEEEPRASGEEGSGPKAEDDVDAEAAEHAEETTQERLVRRRRLIRKRRIDGSDLSWFQELLDCSTLLLKKRLPTCHDCETAVLSRFIQALDELEDDQDQYERFMTEFADEERASTRAFSEDGVYDTDEWQVDPELRALEEEERRLQAELEAIEDETVQVTAKRRELWSTGMDLEHLVHGTFAEGAFLQHLLGLSRDERQSVGVFAVHASDMLRRLQRYNVCNDVFHIWHDGLFGTINGLRLGRLPSKPVEWVEINAALGQAVLLLATIADRANFEFSRNRLVPRGSFSRVVNMYGKEYSLYSDGGMFRRRGFNQAMILFLECVEDAGRRAMKEEPSLKFPYKVERGKIGGLPISLGNDEQWTRALKYMLTHLKWLLAWISKRY